jgi:hypothetical protein
MLPRYVTFSGIDAEVRIAELIAMSRDYPIEWGISLHPTLQGSQRYPLISDLSSILSDQVNFSAHLCGSYARDFIRGVRTDPAIQKALHRVRRIQVNISGRGVEPKHVAEAAAEFAVRGILQCRSLDRFPDDTCVDWLFDRSRGTGRVPKRWPAPSDSAAFVGYSGGLGPDTIAEALAAIRSCHPDHVPFWLDMETGVRTDNRFDLKKSLRVCETIFG